MSSNTLRTLSHLLTASICADDDEVHAVTLGKPDHANAVNLARRFTAQNENDLMRKYIREHFVLRDPGRSHHEFSFFAHRGEHAW